MEEKQIKKVRITATGDIVVPRPKMKLPDVPQKEKKEPGQVRLIKVGAPKAARANRADFGGNGHWIFDEKLNPTDNIGFVYLVHDTANQKYYVGKKFFKVRIGQNKGNMTDWPWYVTSCKDLVVELRIKGKIYFDFYILDQYKFAGSIGFAETWTMCTLETPSYPEKYYNSLIQKVSWVVKEPVSQKHKDRLQAIISNRQFELPVYDGEE